MKYLVIGAGRQAHGVVLDLLSHEDGCQIVVIDREDDALDELAKAMALWPVSSEEVSVVTASAADIPSLRQHFEWADGAISTVPYEYNLGLTELAIETKTNFVDLGGNNDVVKAQHALHAQAENRGVRVVPDCGVAPGLVGILGMHAYEKMKSHHGEEMMEIQMRVGGLPQRRDNPLQYGITFSVHGLVNEYIEPCTVIRKGVLTSRPGMGDREIIPPDWFEGHNLGTLEAFNTSGGASTLPQTLHGKSPRVWNLDYKTIRYGGHCRLMKAMLDTFVLGQSAESRQAFEDMLGRCLPTNGPDMIILSVAVAKRNHHPFYRIEIVDYNDENLTAMMRMTAFPASIILQTITASRSWSSGKAGVLNQETCVDSGHMLRELSKRGIRIKEFLD